ncbi:hypothetical protein Tco_0339216 [Tanacetum coccineum]
MEITSVTLLRNKCPLGKGTKRSSGRHRKRGGRRQTELEAAAAQYAHNIQYPEERRRLEVTDTRITPDFNVSPTVRCTTNAAKLTSNLPTNFPVTLAKEEQWHQGSFLFSSLLCAFSPYGASYELSYSLFQPFTFHAFELRTFIPNFAAHYFPHNKRHTCQRKVEVAAHHGGDKVQLVSSLFKYVNHRRCLVQGIGDKVLKVASKVVSHGGVRVVAWFKLSSS